ncbi:Sec1-like protein [Carpediemonas membranifera]|uniref:Sec1-like protein n=1 Tax=Carpediemonas membranifera TaxID=201153 RepID=A0A8J6BCF4_9EUKA|nr:Sec1-like protein [Carpediemonas membranifera]|eukprot:KAG9394512.1 Sec1-like protein [Carpediemonas membranifera]
MDSATTKQSEFYNNTQSSVVSLLNFHASHLSLKNHVVVPKVLIYDEPGMVCVSAFSMNMLLEKGGVCLFYPINDSTRLSKSMPTFPAVYLCLPTQANIKRILDDIQKDRYAYYFINFTRPLTDATLQSFKASLAELPVEKQGRINGVHSTNFTYMIVDSRNFVTLAGTELGHKVATAPTYFTHLTYLYPPRDAPPSLEAEDYIRDTVSDLSGALLAHRMRNPVVVYQQVTGAEKVAKQLCKRQEVEDDHDSLLIIIDRQTDFGALVAHSLTYAALIHSVWGIHRNTVKTDVGGDGAKTTNLFPNDEFWRSFSGDDLEMISNTTSEQITELIALENRLKDPDSLTKVDVSDALTQMRETIAKKATVTTHVTLASNTTTKMKDMKTAPQRYISRDAKLTLPPAPEECGTAGDYVRAAVSAVLMPRGPDSVGDYIATLDKRWPSNEKRTGHVAALNAAVEFKKAVVVHNNKKLLDRALDVIKKKSDWPIPATVKNLVTADRIPEGWATMDLSGEALTIAAPQLPKGRVMLFVVGGGSYHEQRALERHFAQLNIDFVYGSTGIPTPDEVLSAFARWNAK